MAKPADDKKASNQARVSPISGVAPPTHSQFGQPGGNPRNNGSWKKEDTLRFKIEATAKMGDAELDEVIADYTSPRLVRNFALAVKESKWREIKEIIEMIYGKPKESVDMTSGGEKMQFPTVRIIDERQRDTDTN